MGLPPSGAPHTFDNVAVWDGVDSHCVLEQPVEQLPPVAGGTAIEAEGVLIKVVVEVFVADCPLMGPVQPALQQPGLSMAKGQEILSDGRGFAYDDMPVSCCPKTDVPRPAVRSDLSPRSDGLRYSWLKARAGCPLPA